MRKLRISLLAVVISLGMSHDRILGQPVEDQNVLRALEFLDRSLREQRNSSGAMAADAGREAAAVRARGPKVGDVPRLSALSRIQLERGPRGACESGAPRTDRRLCGSGARRRGVEGDGVLRGLRIDGALAFEVDVGEGIESNPLPTLETSSDLAFVRIPGRSSLLIVEVKTGTLMATIEIKSDAVFAHTSEQLLIGEGTSLRTCPLVFTR